MLSDYDKATVLLHEIYGINAQLAGEKPSVPCRMFNAQHGFCDADSQAWDACLAQQADEDAELFISLIQQKQEA
ncbi:hypothetical protein [Klebsiella huaxiensis]|uniref:hypothetical protein n=1 Tax=Klebsiella huaxiensis TaxID=2153354 RepID=UPI002F352936